MESLKDLGLDVREDEDIRGYNGQSIRADIVVRLFLKRYQKKSGKSNQSIVSRSIRTTDSAHRYSLYV